ncbi:ornithine cyclodeaminase family protein [Devosia sp.]|uniref:ornithine cyclodeaminase family protein n=1 Tax=Devosia sp. TaxID=1871048 RepID=UPI003BAAAD8B
MPLLLTDTDLARLPTMQIAIAAIEEAMAARTAGTMVAPPRHSVPFAPQGGLTFTIGGRSGGDGIAGFRVYDTFGGEVEDQLVAAWSIETKRLLGVYVGRTLGDIRTGAIGGVAVRHLCSADADSVAVIGTGAQARTQLAAVAAVRPLRAIQVFGRNPARLEAFVAEMSAELKQPVTAASSARAAVAEAAIVICATTSSTPVLEAGWLRPGAHINTVGPKSVTGHELGLDVAERAVTIATDSPDQVRAYDPPFFLDGTSMGARMIDLADIVSGKVKPRPQGDEMTLFCSTGLAGTEALVAARVFAAHLARGKAQTDR